MLSDLLKPGVQSPVDDPLPDPDRPEADGRRAWGWWPQWVVTLLCFAAYLALSWGRWRRMDAPSWDLGMFTQAVKGYANLTGPIIDLLGPGYSRLGDHFSPLLVVLAPFYKAFPSPVTLLVAQCLLVAVSIVPVMMTARRFLGDGAAVLLGVAYGLSWGFQSGVDAQFHEYALAVPLLAFALWALLLHRWTLACVLTLLLLGVKEDLGFNVTALGGLVAGQALLRRRRAKRTGGPGPGPDRPGTGSDNGLTADAARQLRIGWTMALAGLIGTVLILFVLIPAFSPDGSWTYWNKLDNGNPGPTGLGATLNDLTDRALSVLTPNQKVNTLVLLAAVTIGSCVFSPLALIAVPTLLWRFLSTNHYYWGSDWHYSMILMPILFMAAIDGLRRLRGSASRPVRVYSFLVPPLAFAFTLMTCLAFPLKDIWKAETYQPPPRAGEAAAIMALLPSGTSVATDASSMTALVTDHTVYWLWTVRDHGVVPDYFLVDPQAGHGDNDPGDPATMAEEYFPDTHFATIYDATQSGDDKGYRLARHQN
jgi:hypothetical protein